MTNEETLLGVLNGVVRIKLESGDTYSQDEFGWHHDRDLMTDSPDDFARADGAIDALNELSIRLNHPERFSNEDEPARCPYCFSVTG